MSFALRLEIFPEAELAHPGEKHITIRKVTPCPRRDASFVPEFL